jgi:hypothetical protein
VAGNSIFVDRVSDGWKNESDTEGGAGNGDDITTGGETARSIGRA